MKNAKKCKNAKVKQARGGLKNVYVNGLFVEADRPVVNSPTKGQTSNGCKNEGKRELAGKVWNRTTRYSKYEQTTGWYNQRWLTEA